MVHRWNPVRQQAVEAPFSRKWALQKLPEEKRDQMNVN